MARKQQAQDAGGVDYMGVIEELEKVVKIQSVTLGQEDRLSTGLLCADLLYGKGGISPGMHTMAGPEQSAKTTFAIWVLAHSIKQSVGLRVLWDAENSSGSSVDYVESIFRAAGTNTNSAEIFGIKKDGKYLTKPMIYYRDEGEMETFFDWLSGLLRRLPDKRYEDGEWWLIYEGTRENKAKFKGQYDVRMTAKNDAVYIKSPDGGALQAIILEDSWPALLPKSMDTDDPKAGMALQAREFSKHLPRVKGRLRAKRVALIGINQLREKPGVMYGDPLYEPGGQALRFNSDTRIWMNPRALSGVPFNPKGKGQNEIEEGIEGGEDLYRYVHVKARKNKLSVPGLEMWFRIWVRDEHGVARGFCPVWDTFYAMHLTGQVTGKRSAMRLNISGLGEAKKTISWLQFKHLILGTKEDQAKIYKYMGYPKPVNLRAGLMSMSKKGKLETLFLENLRADVSKRKAKEEAGDDGDDDDADEV